MDFRSLSSDVLNDIFKIIAQLSRYRNLDDLLVKIHQTILGLIRGSDFVCIYMYRSDLDALTPVSGVGFDLPILSSMFIRPGESMTGMAYSMRQPLLFATSDEIKEAWQSLMVEHDVILRSALGRPTNPLKSFLCAPLLVGETVIGVITVGNYEANREFDVQDLTSLSILADHAAVALQNALENRRAESQINELQETLSLQRQLLVNFDVSREGIHGLTRRLYEQIGKPLKLVNLGGNTLCAIAEECATFETQFVILAGEEKVGFLSVYGEISVMDRIAIKVVLPFYGIELEKLHFAASQRISLCTEYLNSILLENELAIVNGASFFNLQDTSQWRFVCAEVACIQMDGPYTSLQNVLDKITKDTPHHFLAGRLDSLFIFLIDDAIDFDDWRKMHWKGEEDSLRIIWGSEGFGLARLTASLRNLLAFRHYILSRHTKNLVATVIREASFPEYSMYSLLDKTIRTTYIESVLSGILQDEILLTTLLIWIQSNRSYSDAAKRLYTHSNTVRYRLEKIQEKLNKNFNDDDEWLRVRIACDLLVTLR